MIDRIKFWYHPRIGGTGIQGLLESYYDIRFKELNSELVNTHDKNIIIFFWETTTSINLEFKTNNSDFFELMMQLNDLGFYFLADYTTESNNFIDKNRIDFLDKLNSYIDLDRFFIVSNNSDSDTIKKIAYGHHNINHIHFPHFLSATPLKMKDYISDISYCEKKKDFICLNRRVQPHKFDFINKLYNRGLLSNTYLTWVSTKFDLETIKSNPIYEYLNLNNLPLQLDGDVMYGEQLDTADQHLYTINPKWYFESKVNLVVETNGPGGTLHLTEKTFKPIYLQTPFVFFSSEGHLDKLKEFGFDTFQDVIGEYQCHDIDSVIDAGLRLSQIYDNQSVIDVCKFNRKLLLSKDTHIKIIDNYFLKNIKNNP